MKKRILSTLLCVTIIATMLVGCGKDVEKAETNETLVEVEQKEEVQEETFVESEWKEENIVLGEIREVDFGRYMVIEQHEENPNLEKYEIEFDGHIFQVSLPKDVGDNIEYNEDKHVLNFFNSDKSKVVSIVYTKGAFNSLTATDECEYVMSEIGADTTNEEIVVLDETTYKAYQFGKNEVYLNLAYLSCWNIGTEKTYKDKIYENVGYNYRLFYGETNDSFNRDTVKTIMESFKFITDKNESILYSTDILNKSEMSLVNNQLDSQTLEKFGLNDMNLIFNENTTIETGTKYISLKINNATENEVRTYLTEISNKVELKGIVIFSFDLETEINNIVSGVPTTYSYSQNGKNYMLMMAMNDNVLEMNFTLN